MKLDVVNGTSNPQETNSTNNFVNCKFQTLTSDNEPANRYNFCSNDLTVAGDHPPPLRRIRTAVPPPIICSNASFSSHYSSTSSPSSQSSPCVQSPWNGAGYAGLDRTISSKHGLIGTLIREDGHVYSISASGDLLYTGSESKNIRVWKNMEEFAAFKSGSGLVKAIVVSGERIFTGHQDGKVRIWRLNDDHQKKSYVRIGNLPKSQDLIVKSMNPRNYVEVRRKRNVPWIKHYDAVSCLSIDRHHGLLYSGSWDKTLKVWRISDSKCLESIQAHDDAINSVAAAFAGMVFTGSADGTVKAWRRSYRTGNHTRAKPRHVLVETLLKQEHAVTSLAATRDGSAGMVYAGSSDGLVSFWERQYGVVVYGGALRGHKSAVLCVAVGGKLVASGSADKSICLWRRDAGGDHACVAVLAGHEGPVKCLAMAKDTWTTAMEEEEEDGRSNWIVYSGSLDKTVRIWRVAEDMNHPGLIET